MWKNLDKETIKRLKKLSNTEPKGLIQASTNFSEERMEEKGELDHYIGVATTKTNEDQFTTLTVASSTWAVFEIENSTTEKIQNTWGRIFSEWFAESGFELSEGPEILWNENKDTSSHNFKSEIWIPVVAKQ